MTPPKNKIINYILNFDFALAFFRKIVYTICKYASKRACISAYAQRLCALCTGLPVWFCACVQFRPVRRVSGSQFAPAVAHTGCRDFQMQTMYLHHGLSTGLAVAVHGNASNPMPSWCEAMSRKIESKPIESALASENSLICGNACNDYFFARVLGKIFPSSSFELHEVNQS
jgi:hypothetical protein